MPYPQAFRNLGVAVVMAVFLGGLAAGGGGRAQAQANPPTPEATQAARYRRLDRLARELPEAQARTVAGLARNLAAAARSDDDKARLIFAWLAHHVAYDTGYLQGDTGHTYAPAEVLRRRLSICAGYAYLFTELARLMHLPAHTVTGYARTGAPNTSLKGPGHAWNVYRAGGTWHLADATWAAGSVSAAYRFAPGYNPFWFDTDPAAFVFSHVPADSTRQLLPAAVRAEQVHAWPYVEPELLRRGVSGAALLRALGRSQQTDAGSLPEAFPAPFEAWVEQVPLRAELEPRRAAVFRFTVPEGTEIAVAHGRRTEVLPANGPFREATLRPEPGPLTVLLWSRHDPYSPRYTLLRYRVAPVRPLREMRRRFPDPDNVAYMVRRRAQWPAAAVAPPR